ncbi:hypothetical protein L3Q72_11570 [Vibrio sp. JC009]|uniref:hypothetical protein n=1 Tax=Vibrio sp. JC009 TaxID=2912314 RepID=UPI0023AF3ADA|nr:hypothetical protein [Vibrio sp. JC009]WED21275.1 hypothetical protein L3Q72_11570 [Vibrio sp. JC009]
MKQLNKGYSLGFVLILLLAGCASDQPLGSSVALVKAEQTYNPSASVENLGYMPTGSGERMQSTLEVYHDQTSSTKASSDISAGTVLAIPLN